MDASAMEAGKTEPWYSRIMERGGKMFYNAPCMIFIASDCSSYANIDCGIVSQNIALAAHSMGLGSVICGMARIPLNGSKGEEFKKRLKIPEGYEFGMSVCVGNANSGKAPHELVLSKVTYV
jgi:nitroreductase